MSVFSINSGDSFCYNEGVLSDYTDVYFHGEDNSIVQGHMAIIAPRSPFCHRFFKTRRSMRVVDMFFPQIRHAIIDYAVNVLYGKHVEVPKSDVKRVASFLNILQVKFKSEPNEGNGDDDIPLETCEQAKGTENVVQGNVNIDDQAMLKECFSSENDVVKLTESDNSENEEGQGQEYQESSDPGLAHEMPEQSSSTYNLKDHLDDWTLTTTDSKKLEDIEHIIVRGEGRKSYKCKICFTISKAFHNAVTHYKSKHQDLKSAAATISSVEKKRAELKEEFHAVTKSGIDGPLLQHECAETVLRFQNLISELENVSKCLPVQVEKMGYRLIF